MKIKGGDYVCYYIERDMPRKGGTADEQQGQIISLLRVVGGKEYYSPWIFIIIVCTYQPLNSHFLSYQSSNGHRHY